MSDLIDRIPGNESAIAALKLVSQTTAELKARQRITGRSGQLGYAVQSPAAWDITDALPVPPGSSYFVANYAVVFTRTGEQDFPIALISTDMRINGTADTNRLVVIPSSGLYTYNDGTCDVIVQTFELPDPAYFESKTQSAWGISIAYSGNVTVRIKARGQATSPGSFAVTRLP